MSLILALMVAGRGALGGEARRLGDTAEWKAYRAVLRKAKSYSVGAMFVGRYEPDGMARYVALLIKNELGQVMTQRVQVRSFWDGKKGFGVDDDKKTWWEAQGAECSFPLSLLEAEGEPPKGKQSGDVPVVARLTRSYVKGEKRREEVGWEVSMGGRDTSEKIEIWFDLGTHLPVAISSCAWGMLGEEGATMSTYIQWDLTPIKAGTFSMEPPRGFKKVGSQLEAESGIHL